MLLTFIPVVQELLDLYRFQDMETAQQQIVLAEVIRPQKKEQQKQNTERIKQVGAPAPRSNYGSSGMKFNFTPDLNIEGSGGEISASTGNFNAVIFEEGQTDENAVPLNTPMPAYPKAAQERSLEGEVEIIFVVNTEGKVETVNIVRAPHQSFLSEVRKTLNTWRFKPAKNQGVPVKVRMKQVIKFQLEDE